MPMIRTIIICSAALLLSVEAWAIGYEFRQGKGLELSWQTDDRVGVTTGNVSYGTMEQLSFWTSSKESASRLDRSLYAVGYQLKPTTTYYSYSPYKWVENFDAHNIRCRYDQQKQSGNGSTSGLALCDYQMTKATTSTSDCTFPYRHIGGVMRISFLAPTAMTIAELKITTDTPTLATTAVMDIIDQKVVLEGYAAALKLTTENISVAKGEEAVLYLSIPAQDLSSTMISISVKDDKGAETSIATLKGPNIKAGYLYDMPLTKVSRAAAKAFAPTKEAAPQKAAGISNPVAHAEDILTDTDYKCEVVSSISPLHINNIKDNNYYTLQGMKTTMPVKGQVYIHKGKKTIF